jgi:hypothetical protein
MKKTLLFGFAALSLCLAADYVSEGDLWWGHIQYLADDSLQGRDTGSDGYRKAVEYVAGKMETFGLKAAGTDGYLQNVKFETRQVVEAESSIALVREGNEEKLERADATMNSRVDEGSVEAPMVFVGYGLRIPEAKYDELAGIDLKGKIAVYVNAAGPVETSGNIKSHYSSAVERWNTLKNAGAVGVATMMNPRAPVGANPAGTDGAGGADVDRLNGRGPMWRGVAAARGGAGRREGSSSPMFHCAIRRDRRSRSRSRASAARVLRGLRAHVSGDSRSGARNAAAEVSTGRDAARQHRGEGRTEARMWWGCCRVGRETEGRVRESASAHLTISVWGGR